MLEIKILIEEQSNFTGCIQLYLNQGGVRSAKVVNKQETVVMVKPLFDRPKST